MMFARLPPKMMININIQKFNLALFVSVLNKKTVFGVVAAGITLLIVRQILTRRSPYDQFFTYYKDCVLPPLSSLYQQRHPE